MRKSVGIVYMRPGDESKCPMCGHKGAICLDRVMVYDIYQNKVESVHLESKLECRDCGEAWDEVLE